MSKAAFFATNFPCRFRTTSETFYVITIHIILINGPALPITNIAIIQIVLISTPFQILSTIVGFIFIFMIYYQPRLIAIYKSKTILLA